MISKIYLDMDGVLTNFEKRYFELFGVSPKGFREDKEFGSNWKKLVEGNNFEKLEWFPGAQELIAFIEDKNIPIEILTSSGGEKYHDDVTTQKIKWCVEHDIHYPVNVVAGRKFKKDFASKEVVLIDDTDDVIESFNAAGGIGILHKNLEDTLTVLRSLLNNNI